MPIWTLARWQPDQVIDERASSPVLGLTVAILLAVITQGCGGMTGPPNLSRSEWAAVKDSRLDLRLGVRGSSEEQRNKFIAAMRERQLFREVAFIVAFDSPPDLVAEVTWFINADNPLPFITFLTLGLVPTVAKDTQRWAVTFTVPGPKPRPTVEVVYEYRSTFVLGWWGLFATIAPGWIFPAQLESRMIDHLTLAIAKKSDDLRALARWIRPPA